MVAVDLTNMDDIILDYLDFFSTIYEPEKITFIHAVEQAEISEDISKLFPELEHTGSVGELISDELRNKITEKFSHADPSIDYIIEQGAPAQTTLQCLEEQNPDLMVLGRKSGYEGEGVLLRKVAKYAHCSLLIVDEDSRHQIEDIHVPISFSKASSRALKCARSLSEKTGGKLHVQHVYKYPRQFFPYIPSDKYSERMNEHLQRRYEKFKTKYNLEQYPDCTFTVCEDEKEVERIYNFASQIRADIILAGSRSKSSTAAFLTHELADDLVEYDFGIPLLIYRNKEEHTGLLKSLLEES